jgi:hypothetical protein
LEAGGARVSLSICRESDGYIYATITIDENPRVWGLFAELVFDDTRLTHVSSEEGEIPDFTVLLPSTAPGLIFSNRRGFGVYILLGDASDATGSIATARFRITGEIGDIVPIAIRFLEVPLYVPEYPNRVRDYLVTASRESILSRGIPVSEHEFAAFTDRIPEGKIMLGDVTGIGRVRFDNPRLIAEHVVGIPPRTTFIRENADINRDGIISLADASMLLRQRANGGGESGDEHAPTIFRLIGLDVPYRVLVNSSGNATGRIADAHMILNELKPIFLEQFNTNLIRQRTSTGTPALNRGSHLTTICARAASDMICFPDNLNGRGNHFACPPVNGSSNCIDSHHSAVDHFKQVLSERNINTFRFVDYDLCTSRGGHNRVDGSASSVWLGRDMIVSFRTTDDQRWRKVVSHEISHIIGAQCQGLQSTTVRCTPDEACVMRYDDRENVHDRWCTRCTNQILEKRPM